MPLSDITILRNSKITKRIISTKFDGIAETYTLKIRVELKNGWLLDYWEHKAPKLRRYSFHVFKDSKMIVRWDNSPHYPNVSGFPHHKHVGNQVFGSKEMTAAKVLVEIETMIETQRKK